MSDPVDVLAVVQRLDAIARPAEIPYPCWLGGDDADQGPSYCRECAQKHVDAGHAAFVDGGWPQDNDGCCHCEDCGRLLDYTLTEYGVQEEYDHFKRDRLRRKMTPELAYHLARLLEAHDQQPEVLRLLPKVRRALARVGGAS